MNLQVFQRRYELPLAALRGLIQEAVLKTGDKSEDCQQTTLLTRLDQLERAFNGTEEADLVAHSIFLRPLGNLEEAKELFRYLKCHDLLFHPEDDPEEISHTETRLPLFTADESRELRHRMDEAYELDWQEHDCPCGFCLALDEEDESGV